MIRDYLDIRDAKAHHLKELKNKRWFYRTEYQVFGHKKDKEKASEINYLINKIRDQDLDSYYLEYLYPFDDELAEILSRY